MDKIICLSKVCNNWVTSWED